MKNKINEKKEMELELLHRFLNVYNKKYDNNVKIVSATEEPDFIVDFRRNIVGVEITEIHKMKGPKGSEIKRCEVFKEQFINEVKEKMKKKYQKSLTVIFNLNDDLFKKQFKDKEKLKKVVNLIYKNIPQDENETVIIDNLFNYELADIINEICIRKHKKDNWTHIEANSIGPAIKDIKTTINEKEDKYSNYIKHNMNPESIWLVVIANGADKSSSIDFNRINNKMFSLNSNFDRIYLFGDSERKIICLK